MKHLVFLMLISSLLTSNAREVRPMAYQLLPIGEVEPQGWLRQLMERQRDGLTGKMDAVYPQVMGERNGWLGGDGDQWERGPYWIDGLLTMAYTLHDKALQKKVQPWIEWSLKHQRENGFFGPDKDYPHEAGLQRDNAHDWWPRMVMLKIMRDYYEATADKRVIPFLQKYFKYQLKTLPEKPLGNWTFWARFRECDNLSVVLWLYDITHEDYLLELADLLHKQAFDFTAYFESEGVSRLRSIHCVNLAQGLKEPVVYWRCDPQDRYLAAVNKGLEDIRRFNGFPNGMYGGDEALHGNNPLNGSELCSAVELMYSMEEMARTTGNTVYADYLERVAYNALPTQITDDFMGKQYYQQINQVIVKSGHGHNFDQKQDGTALDFGILSGYPCCLSNFHQGWSKFVRNLWMRSDKGALTAMAYAPSSVTTKINDKTVIVKEETMYPFDENIVMTIMLKGTASLAFPLEMRIPAWCKSPKLKVNGMPFDINSGMALFTLNRTWKSGDKIELQLPMEIKTSRWYENSLSVERGPLVYALRIEEKWSRKIYDEPLKAHGEYAWEVYPETAWNYALLEVKDMKSIFEVKIDQTKLHSGIYPWSLAGTPIELTAKAKEVPFWKLYDGHETGPLPFSPIRSLSKAPVKTVRLVPYGCTTLRIAEFPTAY